MFMKRFIFIFTLMLGCFDVNIYGGDGDWRIYSAYHNATKVVDMDHRIFVLSDGGLYSYDPEDTFIETYDKCEALSDYGIFDIQKCEATGELVIVYKNGNIDIMSKEGTAYNMSELKTKALSDKKINDTAVFDNILYISTNAGIVCVDIKKRIFTNYYNFGQRVLSMVVYNGKIICSTNAGPYHGDMSKNLLDPANWEKVGGTAAYHKYRLYDNVIYCLHSNQLAYCTNIEKMAFDKILSENTTEMSVCNGRMFISSNTGNLYEFKNPKEYKKIDNPFGILSMVYTGSTYWAACQTKGLMGLEVGSDNVSEKVSTIIPDSPFRNYAYHLNMIDNKRLLVTGGAFNYTADTERTGTIMAYEDGKWTNFDEEPLNLYSYIYYRNALDVVQDPDDPQHHFVGMACSGLFEFQDYKFVKRYSMDNSPLTTILPDDRYAGAFVRVAGLTYDSQKNLWMCNTECPTIIRIMKNDGSWTSYYVPEIDGNPTFDQILFDNKGYAWINSRRLLNEKMHAGVLVINTNGNPGDPSGFSHRFMTSFYNQDGTAYNPTLMNCLCFDLDGTLWLGYDVGLFAAYNPLNIYGGSNQLTQVKVPRNDGTNLADYLLSGVSIKCITIDGGNRKWIGTETQGVYLISADGLEMIEHFTKENSPLIDNFVSDIKINGETGEVFFATNGGLCSFIGDATDPVASFDKDLVKVYPNPVRPEYDGNIVIRGLMYNSNVKIVNAAGKLVHEGTSVGGEYKWDGCMQNRKKCASGIYYILATDEQGKNGVVGKFLVVR